MKYLFNDYLILGLNQDQTELEISHSDEEINESLSYSEALKFEQAVRALINEMEEKRRRERKPFWKRIFN